MPPIKFQPRVKETSTSTGSGDITLAGAVVGYQSFDDAFAVTDDYFYYCIEGVDGNGVPTGQWEEGIGHLSASTTLVRDTLLSSSTGSAVSFSAGTKNVFCTVAADFFTGYDERVLSRTVVDLNDGDTLNQLIFTSPAGLSAVPVKFIFHSYSATTAGVGIGLYDNVIDDVISITDGEILIASTRQRVRVFTVGQEWLVQDKLYFRNTTPDGSPLTCTVDFIGYLVPDVS